MPREAGAINGGMMKRHLHSEYPMIVVNVNSVDDALDKIQKAGGKVVLPKQKVGDFGYYARFSDTEGNIVGLWQNIK
jgi:predicted enzyme related to lactoylglutathione lyase